jgi:hypothetical protein
MSITRPDLHDLPLRDSPTGSRPPGSPPSAPTRWVILAAVVVVAGSVVAWWWLSRAQPIAAPPPAAAPTDVSVDSTRPKRQPVDLPPLDASDDVLRRLVSQLSSNPLLARLLATTGLARAATLTVVQIAQGRTPSLPLAPMRPSTRIAILGTGSARIDPQSYHRWDAATAALVSIRPDELAQVYVNVKPLIDQAYRDLGYQDGNFDDAIAKAMAVLRETPDVLAEPVLLQRPGYFEFEDPALRALLPVQKQLLLVGPENRRRIGAWLDELAKSLDLRIGN